MKPNLMIALPLLLGAAGCTASTVPAASVAQAQPLPYQTNVLEAAKGNAAYRHVLFTGARSQLALMTLEPGADIGMESHPHVEQLIFIASGKGKAVVNGVETAVEAGDVIVATPGVSHDVVNTGTQPLRIYTVYSPPNHIDGRVHPTKADAERDKDDEAFGEAVR